MRHELAKHKNLKITVKGYDKENDDKPKPELRKYKELPPKVEKLKLMKPKSSYKNFDELLNKANENLDL
jgi:hypothetical protein